MADKKKLDTAALKPESVSSEDEVVNIDLGDGEITTLYRGTGSKRMDDAQWARLKQRAMPVESAKKEISGGQLMQIARGESSVARSVISEDEQKTLDGMSEGSRYEFLRQRFKHKGYAVPDAAAPAAKASGSDSVNLAPPPSKTSASEGPEKRAADQAEAIPSFEDRERIRKMGDKADKLRIKQLDKEAGDLKDLEATGAMGMGANPRNPASLVPQVSMGAIDPNGRNPITGNSDVHLQRAIDKGNATGESDLQAIKDLNDNVGQTMKDMALMVPRTAAKVADAAFGGSPLLSDEVKQDLSGAGDFVQNVGAKATQQFAVPGAAVASAAGMPGIANKLADVASNVQFAPKNITPNQSDPNAPINNTLPQPPPTNPRLNGSDSASASVRIPSSFKQEEVDPELLKQYDADRLTQKGKISDALDTLAAGEIVKDGLVRAAAEREKTVRADAAKLSHLATQARLDSIEEARGYQTRKLALAKQAQEAAATPTDPNRFWNNKDAGQKAAAVIAGALFGFTGQGMQWLQRLDGLVNADNQLQAQDRASKVAGLQQEAETLGEAGRQAMAQGASRAEAFLIERNTKLEGLKSFLDMTTMKTNNVDAKMRGAQMSMQLQDMIVKNDQEALQLGQQRADKKTEWNYRNAELGQSAAIATAKIQAGGNEGTVKGPQAMELGGLAAAEQVAKELKSKFGEKNIISRFLDKGLSLFPGTSAKNYNIAREQAINMIAPLMGAGVLQKHDLDRWEGLMAKAGDVNGEEMLNILLTDIQRTYNSKRAALGQAGMNVQQFPVLGGPAVNFTPTR